ncbi:MAG: uS17 family ribosomal protein [Candidatus Dojkabacteria bacterium]|nr:uS17 family ribosomal protein [Candidatus Dojkabacteria bacterium]MDQ7021381.1 uS17 family ribosomal protein [Candidatus Dojkabacteria bacterium]
MTKNNTEKKVIKREVTGEVVKISSTNTVKIRVEIKFAHPLYEKILKKHKNFLVHASDKQIENIKVGDTVIAESCKPISKNKTFILKD